MSQSYIHLFHLLLLQATVSVACTLTATVLFPYVFFTRKGGVLEEPHSTHTLFPAGFHLHRIMAAEAFLKLHLFLWFAMCLRSDADLGLQISAFNVQMYSKRVCVRSCDLSEGSDRVWQVGAVNWIEDVRKTMSHSPQALIRTVNWTEWGKGPGRKTKPSKQSGLGGNVKRGCITTTNENTLSSQPSMAQPSSRHKDKKKTVHWKSTKGKSRVLEEEDNALFLWKILYQEQSKILSSLTDACGITIILIHQTVLEIISLCSLHQGPFSFFLVSIQVCGKFGNTSTWILLSWTWFTVGFCFLKLITDLDETKTNVHTSWNQTEAEVRCIDCE